MLKRDNLAFGILLGLASIVFSALIVYVVFLVCNLPVMLHQRFFLLAFLPGIFLFRYYIKNLKYHKTAKGLLLILFILIIVFIIYLAKTAQILHHSV